MVAPAVLTDLDKRTCQAEPDLADSRPVVLHLISSLDTGGAERMLQRVATSPSSYRHVIVSLGSKGPIGGELEAAGAEVHALQLGRGAGLVEAYRRLRAIESAASPVAIQGWMAHANIAASLLRITSGKWTPLVWGVRQSVDFTGERMRTRLLIYASVLLARLPDAIVYNSETGAAQHEAIGYPRSKRHVIPNGFDLEEYRPSPTARSAMRADLGVADNELLVGMVGRLHPVKNHRGFLAAAAVIARARSDVRFLLAGRGIELANAAFQDLVAESQIDPKRLILLGERTDVASVMRALDIAANVSFAESFPNVVGEALACGVPCVVTAVGDSALIVQDAGVICETTDAAEIADSILQLVTAGRARRAQLAARAVSRMREHYSLPSVMAMFDSLYRSAADAEARRNRTSLTESMRQKEGR